MRLTAGTSIRRSCAGADTNSSLWEILGSTITANQKWPVECLSSYSSWSQIDSIRLGSQTDSMPKLQIYVSDALGDRLRQRASTSGVSVSALACVLLDQGLVLYEFPKPASSAEELAGQADEIARRVGEAGLARLVGITQSDSEGGK